MTHTNEIAVVTTEGTKFDIHRAGCRDIEKNRRRRHVGTDQTWTTIYPEGTTLLAIIEDAGFGDFAADANLPDTETFLVKTYGENWRENRDLCRVHACAKKMTA